MGRSKDKIAPRKRIKIKMSTKHTATRGVSKEARQAMRERNKMRKKITRTKPTPEERKAYQKLQRNVTRLFKQDRKMKIQKKRNQ